MNMIICDVVTPFYVYPLLFLPYILAGLVLVAVAILLYRYLKKRKKKDTDNTNNR